jgi:hypothetical protein
MVQKSYLDELLGYLSIATWLQIGYFVIKSKIWENGIVLFALTYNVNQWI